MKRQSTVLAVGIALLALTACGKKEVSVDKVKNIIIENVTAEQKDSGNVLTVDTVFLNQAGNDFRGELRGHVNDSTVVVYDLNVIDEGDELSAEWNLRE